MTAAVVDEYQARTEALAASTVAGVLALYTALRAGELAPASVVPAMAAVIATANAAATTLADVAVSAQIEMATASPQPPTGIAPRDDTARLESAVETILDDLAERTPVEAPAAEPNDPADDTDAAADEPDPAEKAEHRLERLARSEPLDTAQAITIEIVDRLPVVTGWRRKLDADPCQRCVRWAEDGRVFPTGHHFKRHYGCNCAAEITTIATEEGKRS